MGWCFVECGCCGFYKCCFHASSNSLLCRKGKPTCHPSAIFASIEPTLQTTSSCTKPNCISSNPIVCGNGKPTCHHFAIILPCVNVRVLMKGANILPAHGAQQCPSTKKTWCHHVGVLGHRLCTDTHDCAKRYQCDAMAMNFLREHASQHYWCEYPHLITLVPQDMFCHHGVAVAFYPRQRLHITCMLALGVRPVPCLPGIRYVIYLSCPISKKARAKH